MGEAVLDRQRLLQLLQSYHSIILDGLGAGEAALNSSAADAPVHLAAIRWRLVRDLRQYQIFKHRDVFEPFIRSADRSASSMASAMKRRCTDVGERFLAHVAIWSSCDIAGDRAAYDADAARIIYLVRTHLSREQQEIYQLLSRKTT